MKKRAYYIRLTGRPEEPGTLSAIALRDLFDALVDATARVLRLTVEGTSTRPGPLPKWVEESVSFSVLPFQKGSTVLPLQVPELGETAADVIQQHDIWLRKPGFNETALSLLAEASKEIQESKRESDRYDRGVLHAITKFQPLLNSPGVKISIVDEITDDVTIVIDEDYVSQARQLERETPPPRTVALTGLLDLIEYDQQAFKLILEDDRKIRGAITGAAITHDEMRKLWGQKVTIRGRAQFTPARSVQFIEADLIREYRKSDRLLDLSSTSPAESVSRMSHHGLREKNVGNALNKLRGKWPGDESIDELLEALN